MLDTYVIVLSLCVCYLACLSEQGVQRLKAVPKGKECGTKDFLISVHFFEKYFCESLSLCTYVLNL